MKKKDYDTYMEEQFLSWSLCVRMELINCKLPGFGYWGELNGGEFFYFQKQNFDREVGGEGVIALLWQQVFDWFEKEHKISYRPDPPYLDNGWSFALHRVGEYSSLFSSNEFSDKNLMRINAIEKMIELVSK